MGMVIPCSALIVPFSIGYSQMTTVFIMQGSFMEPAGFIDASMMNNVDALSVLFCGFVVGKYFYPYLSKRGKELKLTEKFALGHVLVTISLVCTAIADYAIHNQWEKNGKKISVFWQFFGYFFVGAGEIFCYSTIYDAAFTIAPQKRKGLASAIALFFMGGIPNFICMGLYNACNVWFPNGDTIEDYAESKVYNYLWLLTGICVFGGLICLLPQVRDLFESYLNV